MTSLSCARKALPKSVVHWISPASLLTTSGRPAKAWTLGSQGCFCTASARALSLRLLFFSSHRWSRTISSGYVDAARIWASNGSGYRAIGATRESSCSGEILAAGLLDDDDDGGGDGCCGLYASVSPGTRTSAHRIATSDLRSAPI